MLTIVKGTSVLATEDTIVTVVEDVMVLILEDTAVLLLLIIHDTTVLATEDIVGIVVEEMLQVTAVLMVLYNMVLAVEVTTGVLVLITTDDDVETGTPP